MAWVKQWGSKRWHKTRPDGIMGLCGKRTIATKTASEPPWHVACVGCLQVIQSNRKKQTA